MISYDFKDGNELALTDELGEYNYTSEKSRGKLDGQRLKFEKEGLETSYSEEFTSSEAGSEACGTNVIIRDIEMSSSLAELGYLHKVTFRIFKR